MKNYTKQTPEFWQYTKKAFELEPGDTVLVNYAGREGLPAAKLEIETIVPERGSNKYIIEFSSGAQPILVEPLEEFEVIQPMTRMLHVFLLEWSNPSSKLHEDFYEECYSIVMRLDPEGSGCAVIRLRKHMKRCGFKHTDILENIRKSKSDKACTYCNYSVYRALERMEALGVF